MINKKCDVHILQGLLRMENLIASELVDASDQCLLKIRADARVKYSNKGEAALLAMLTPKSE